MTVHRNVRPRVEALESRLVPSAGTPWPYPSGNWSGYAVDTAPAAVTEVAGSWTVPSVTVSGGGTKYSASWLGIDGDNSSTVEQIGTDSDQKNGQPSYYAWFEMYPSNYYYVDWATGTGIPASSNVPSAALVGANDMISADVKFLSTSGKLSTFQLTITDTPAGGGLARNFSITQTIKGAARSSAEWVLEQTGTLSNFGSETFTNAQATINGATGTIGTFLQGDSSTVVYKEDIVDRHGVSLDRTSELNSTGDGFTVYYGPTLPASPGGGTRGPRELVDDLPVVAPAQVATAGAGSNPTVVAISPATPTSPVLVTGAIVQPGFRLTFSQPEGTAGRADVVVAGLARGEGTLGAGSFWLAPPSGPGAAAPLPVAPGPVNTLPEGVRVRSSAEPFAAAWSPAEQSALASAPALAVSEEVHVEQLAGMLPLLAFLPHLHLPWAKDEPEQARRRPDVKGRPE
jgi:hypothetical protein